MSDTPQKPTILVKKKDGTQVRMTMDEFRAYQRGEVGESTETSQNKTVEAKAKVLEDKKVGDNVEISRDNKENKIETHRDIMGDIKGQVQNQNNQDIKRDVAVHNDLPAVETPHELATITPVPDIFVDEAQAVAHGKTLEPASRMWHEDDHKSLLDEEDPIHDAPVAHAHAKIARTHEEMAQQIVEQLISEGVLLAEHVSRAQSLFLSWFKGVRDNHQLSEYAMRAIGEGGLGLSEDRIRAILESQNHERSVFAKKQMQKTEPRRVIQPVQSVKAVTPTQNTTVSETKSVETQQPSAVTSHMFTEALASVQRPVAKQVVHDVIAPVLNSIKTTTGPEEEMHSFTLVDFRRLGLKTLECQDRLIHKFEGWKTESFLLYMQARKAWFESPLFQSYSDISAHALQEKKTVQDILKSNGKEQMNYEEFLALARVNQGLTV